MHSIKGLKIFRAGVKDAPAIYRLILHVGRRGRVLKRSLSEIGRQINSFFVAKVGPEMAGCASLDVYNRKLAEIRSLVVKVPWEQRSIASALVGRCLREARGTKVYEVLVITDRERLFKRFGFREELHGQKALFYRPSVLSQI